jgi:anhydro-N-acetylmuramic acid kinase
MRAHYLGLISGTSADAIDAALVRFEPRFELVAALAQPYPRELREALLAGAQADAAIDLDAYAALDVRVGAAFAAAAERLLADAGVAPAAVRAIGSHGQTLRHRPRGAFPYTLQIGDPNVIAERLRVTTVADFRRRDVAAGGQGAPLLPPFHAARFAAADEDRVVLNLGGIANVTLLPRSGPVSGFDTGPANALLDAGAARHLGAAHDAAGAWARGGRLLAPLLDALLDDSYFAAPAPKSTGRDALHLEWVAARGGAHARDAAAQDVQRTLVELTAESVARAVRASLPGARRVIACGGGVHNTFLMERLAARLAPIALETTAAHGLDPDFVEAAAFAWLAHETLAGRPGNLVAVTGARGARVLGAVYAA